MSDKKSFKISNLPRMTKKDITGDDLFLVSDATDSNTKAKYASKSLSFGNLSAVVAQTTAEAPVIKTKVETEVKSELSANITTYAPIQRWYADGEPAPVELSSATEEVILSCGSAEN